MYAGVKFDKNKCLCPLHNEKTPSFFVNDKKGVFYCQGCGKGGDHFTFLQEYLNVTFNESVKMIDNDFCLGLCNEKITVEAQNKLREAKKKHEEEEYKKQQISYEYDILCSKYMLVNQLIKELKPMTTMWGKMITKKAFIEYEMDRLMEEY